MKLSSRQHRQRIKLRVRKKISGTSERPRLSVFRSSKAIYVQLIDDLKGHTLAQASSRETAIGNGAKTEQAKAVGQLLASRAIEAGYSKVVFDRSGYLYHGRIKAVADGAREGGLQF